MASKDALEYIGFREKFGDAPLALPTDVWREGLKKPGDRVNLTSGVNPTLSSWYRSAPNTRVLSMW